MKRALKILSPKRVPVSAKSTKPLSEAVSPRADFEQGIAHVGGDESALKIVNELVLTISHYIDSPLTVLLGKVELLCEAAENGGMSREEFKGFAEICKREIFRIEAIMKSFQNLCRVQHKSYPPGVTMLDVEQEIKSKLKETSFLR
ncbi:MAG: hypothetical protein WCE90_02815 [Candidatus Zixiibacteriota bacterium]